MVIGKNKKKVKQLFKKWKISLIMGIMQMVFGEYSCASSTRNKTEPMTGN